MIGFLLIFLHQGKLLLKPPVNHHLSVQKTTKLSYTTWRVSAGVYFLWAAGTVSSLHAASSVQLSLCSAAPGGSRRAVVLLFLESFYYTYWIVLLTKLLITCTNQSSILVERTQDIQLIFFLSYFPKLRKILVLYIPQNKMPTTWWGWTSSHH